MSLWISYGKTESGDDLEIINWGKKKPTEKQVEAKYRELNEIEFEEVGFVHFQIEKAVDA